MSAESLFCISCKSRDEVNRLISKANSLGASVSRAPKHHGFMYGHGFECLDGHAWKLIFLKQNIHQSTAPASR